MLNVYTNTDYSKMFEPVQKMIDLNMSKFEAAVEAQKAATKNFVELTEARVKDASEIKDFDGLASFMNEQVKISQSNLETMVADSKTAVDEVVTYGNEVQAILNDSLKADKTAKKSTAKKAA